MNKGKVPPGESVVAGVSGPDRTGKPVVAIVGRPNVGKSTLFNRLLGARRAIVEDIPGTTRDRLYGDIEWRGRRFLLIDTGGLEPSARQGYTALVRQQVEIAIAEADVILFLVDVRDGITATDLEIAQMLREAGKPALLLANKADNEARRQAAVQFYELALGEPIPISAYHGLGTGEVLDLLGERLPFAEGAVEEEALRLAIVGRPNVGKSLLLNAILGQERVIVSAEPGTTRDAIDTPFEYEGQRLLLIDTAGIRRAGRVQRGIEKYSVLRARQAIERADVALLVVDATEGLAAQDLHIAGYVAEAHKGLVVAINKWDLMEDTDEQREAFAAQATQRLKFVPWAPLCFISAKTGLNIDGLLEVALEAGQARNRRIPTAELNSVIGQAVAAHGVPPKGTRQAKILYVTQAGVAPPTFAFFVNDASLIHFSYRRYLENTIRRHFDFEGTAIRLVFRSRAVPTGRRGEE